MSEWVSGRTMRNKVQWWKMKCIQKKLSSALNINVIEGFSCLHFSDTKQPNNNNINMECTLIYFMRDISSTLCAKFLRSFAHINSSIIQNVWQKQRGGDDSYVAGKTGPNVPVSLCSCFAHPIQFRYEDSITFYMTWRKWCTIHFDTCIIIQLTRWAIKGKKYIYANSIMKSRSLLLLRRVYRCICI